MPLDKLLTGSKGDKVLAVGNEALARAAVEAGISYATGYPGTPSTEALETLARFSKTYPIRVEWSINEKVALEKAYGYSLANLSTLVTMKMSGLNVALDALFSISYSGTPGPMVVYVADDPGAHAGMCEQDSRKIASTIPVPVLSPASSREMYLFTKEAFKLSEKYEIPVIVRSTTITAHSREVITLGEIHEQKKAKTPVKDIKRFTKANPLWCQEQHRNLLDKVDQMKRDSERYVHLIEGSEDFGIIVTGAPYRVLLEIIKRNDLNIPVLNVGMPFPAPEKILLEFIKNLKEVIVIEELEPVLESQILEIIHKHDLKIRVHGKTDGTTSHVGEIGFHEVAEILSKRVKLKESYQGIEGHINVPPRKLTFCAGCPHRNTYFILKEAAKRAGLKELICTGDIGCTILAMYKPLEVCWTEVCMGASIGMAYGLSKALDKKIVAAIGDSTIFHAGLPATVDASQYDANILILVLDNNWVAMTGHQPTPETGIDAAGHATKKISLEKILAGVHEVKIIDPYDIEPSIKIMEEALKSKNLKIIISKHECSLMKLRLGKVEKRFKIIEEKCVKCLKCLRETGCPAIRIINGKVMIMEEICTGCSLCAYICPHGAIVECCE